MTIPVEVEPRRRGRPTAVRVKSEPAVIHSVTLSLGALFMCGAFVLVLVGLTGALNALARALAHPVDRVPLRERGPRLVSEEPPAAP
jgi:hypothetical protein